MAHSYCSCRRQPRASDKDEAQIGPKRIRYLGKGGTRKASRRCQEEEEELSSSVGDRQEAL